MEAIEGGNRSSLMKLVIEHRFDVNKIIFAPHETTLLHLACSFGKLDIVRTLLQVYRCVLIEDANKYTPLHVACSNNHLKVVCYLCHFIVSSDPRLKQDQFFNAKLLKIACQTKSMPMFRIIFSSMQFPNYVKQSLHEDMNALHYLFLSFYTMDATNIALKSACCDNNMEVVKCLCSIEWIFDQVIELVPSLVSIACQHWNYEIIDYFDDLMHRCPQPRVKLSHQFQTNGSYLWYREKSVKLISESALFIAVRRADICLFKHLSSLAYHKCLLADVNSNGDTLLHAACASGDLSMVECVYTLSKADSIDKPNKAGNTCLHVAAELGFLNIAKFLVKQRCKLDTKNDRGETPLHLSILNEQCCMIDYFLEFGNSIDINSSITSGETLLHLLASNLHLYEYAKKIVKQSNFDSSIVDSRDQCGNTPAINASCAGNLDMVELMISEGCDLLKENNLKESVFHIACRLQREDILELAFMNVTEYQSNQKNSMGQTLLHIACKMGSMTMVRYLQCQKKYSLKDDINRLEDSIDLTPLQYACMKNHQHIFEFLVDTKGCDPDTKNKKGYTALHLCCEHNLKDMAKLCFKKCSVRVRNNDGDTPLHLACKHRNFELALDLMSNIRDAKISMDDFFNRSGHSVLHVVAEMRGTLEVIRYMIKKKICSAFLKTRNPRSETALHISCRKEIVENCEYLFSLNYDTDSIYNHDKETALYSILHDNKFLFLQSIIEKVPQWQLRKCAEFPFNSNSENSVVPLLQCLISTLRLIHVNKHNPNQPYSHHNSSSCSSVEAACCSVIDSFSSTITMCDSHGRTALHYLSSFGCYQMKMVVDRIMNHEDGAIIKMTDKFKRSPLHVACMEKNEFMIYCLLQHEAGCQLLHEKDSFGKTPADLYKPPQNFHSSYVISYLAANGADVSIDKKQNQYQQENDEIVPSIDIFVIGHSSVGKSTLIKTMKEVLKPQIKENSQCGSKEQNQIIEPTTGIVPDYVLTHDNHCYNFFDFAGQMEFETLHSGFLESLLKLAASTPYSSPFIFLLLVKSTDSFDENKEQVVKWFDFLCDHLKYANKKIKLALLCSHCDCLKDKEEELRNRDITNYLQSLKIKTSELLVDLNPKPILLNCLETGTTPLNCLMRYLDDEFFSCILATPNYTCTELKQFLSKCAMPCQVGYLTEKIKECRKFKFENECIQVSGMHQMLIPHESNKLVEYLTQLHIQHDIVLLMPPSTDKLSWWIVSKAEQRLLLSEVAAIFSPKNFKNSPNLLSAHNTGVIPSSMLAKIFCTLSLSPDLIENYLICMGYCRLIDDDHVLKLMHKDEEDEKRYLFFPGLIKGEQRVFEFNIGAYHSGWLFEREENKKFGLRFLHSLLLRLTFRFSHDAESRYSKYLNHWKFGISWSTYSGISVLVEVQQDCRVFVFFQCLPSDVVSLANTRSEVINEIQIAMSESIICKNDKISDYYLHPLPQCLKNFDNIFDCENYWKLSLHKMSEIFEREPSDRSLFVGEPSTTPLRLSTILGFDVYVPLKLSTLLLLKGSDNKLAELKQCFDELSSELGKDALEKILANEKVEITSNIDEVWLEKYPSDPFNKICTCLDKFSVFKLNELRLQ